MDSERNYKWQQLASVAADLHITELVDGNKGVHMMIPKAIFISGAK